MGKPKKGTEHHHDVSQTELDQFVQAMKQLKTEEGAATGKATKGVVATNSAKTAAPTEEMIKLAEAYKKEEMARFEAVKKAKHARDERLAKRYTMTDDQTKWRTMKDNLHLRYQQYDPTHPKSEQTLASMMKLFDAQLSEPYTIFTYHYFVNGWPDLCIMAVGDDGKTCPDPVKNKDGKGMADVDGSGLGGKLLGAIICKAEAKSAAYWDSPMRGYIAMLAVSEDLRGLGVGSELVQLAVSVMRQKGCTAVYLETPGYNDAALQLYGKLGFVKSKKLPFYYMDGSDAYRLMLWLPREEQKEEEQSSEKEITDGENGASE